MNYYPKGKLLEGGGISLEGADHVVLIPSDWVEGDPLITSQSGYRHRITLTVFVDDLTIKAGAHFRPRAVIE